ncbi:MAG: pantothenate kinase [Cyanobacteria bacterium P01_A01_bin.84]
MPNPQNSNHFSQTPNIKTYWLALMIGNSRLHWACMRDKQLMFAWDSNHVSKSVIEDLANCKTIEDFPQEITPDFFISPFSSFPIPLVLASVVPSQTELWQAYHRVKIITLKEIPLRNTYVSLGIDRALAVYGAVKKWSSSALIIDAGTALTFTGADSNSNLVGGAILPGLALQLATLSQKTGQLPEVELPKTLPSRYALHTKEAIQSGVTYSILAGIKEFIQNWWELFSESKIVLTGGDRGLLAEYFKSYEPEIFRNIVVEANLIFWGINELEQIKKE